MRRLVPGPDEAAGAGTEASTPVSSTATVTPFPRVTGHAAGALTAPSWGCSAALMLCTVMAGPEAPARPLAVSSTATRPVSTTTPGADR